MRTTAATLALALGFTLTASAQVPRAATRQPTQPRQPRTAFGTPLYQNQGVAKALNLTSDQITRLNQANQTIQQRYQEQFNKLNQTPAQQRAARLREFRQKYNNDFMQSSNDIFNKDQMNRYRQLNLQYQGVNSFYDPTVQKGLSLTDQQRQKLDALSTWDADQRRAYMGLARTDPAAAKRLYGTYTKDLENRVNTLLTAEQQKTWQMMQGEAYRFPPPFATTDR
jgi:hypothetical protein